jgi:hypothetical protein
MSTGRHSADDPTEVTFDPDPTIAQPVSTEPSPTERGADQHQVVTCPECGTQARVALNRRRSEDFCPRCDFPLFWTPSQIVSGGTTPEESGLRRLPGTAGRVTVASRACPHCAESNQVSALTCVRCGGLMDPPEPVVPVAAPAPPPPAPEPEPRRTPWWVWAGLGLTLALLVVVILVLAL